MLTTSLRYAHIDPILVNNDILRLNSILNFEICKYIHRYFCKNNFFNLTPRSFARSYNTRFNTDISLSHVRTNLAAQFVRHKGVKMYNSLSNNLKSIDNSQIFKQL